MDRQFDKGDRVLAKGNPGTVAYRRMKPPEYAVAEVYSVVLDDCRKENPGYVGTIFPAIDVTALEES